MTHRRSPRRPEIGRGGFTMTEVTVAATLLVAVVAVVTPLAVRSGRIRQDTRRHLIACEELSNQLERLTILDGAALEEGIDQLAPSPFVADALPGVTLQAQLVNDVAGRRIVMAITWDRPPLARPITMTAWVVPQLESAEEGKP